MTFWKVLEAQGSSSTGDKGGKVSGAQISRNSRDGEGQGSQKAKDGGS